MNMQVLDASRNASGGYKVDVTRGERVGRVSSEWFSRRYDERFLSLANWPRWCGGPGRSQPVAPRETSRIHVEASRSNAERLALVLQGGCARRPTIGPSASSRPRSRAGGVSAPASRRSGRHQSAVWADLPRAEQIKTFETANGRTELRAVTAPDYGRIYDHELVEAVQRIAGKRHRRHALEGAGCARLVDEINGLDLGGARHERTPDPPRLRLSAC